MSADGAVLNPEGRETEVERFVQIISTICCATHTPCTPSYLILWGGTLTTKLFTALDQLSSIMMALRRLSMRAPTGVRQMSGHSIEEAIRA